MLLLASNVPVAYVEMLVLRCMVGETGVRIRRDIALFELGGDFSSLISLLGGRLPVEDAKSVEPSSI